MKLYFYTNLNVMYDYLGRNLIAPNSVVKDIKGYRTIGSKANDFIFITHKKLDRKSREEGIAEPEFVYPITLELSEPTSEDGKAIFVSKAEEGLDYKVDSLINYDPEKYIGAFILGEIPFSRIDRILFESKEDMDMFYRASPDYWYPVELYDALNEEFNEEMSLEVDENLLSSLVTDATGIVDSIKIREKKRAAFLELINGTEGWEYNDYSFNIDSYIQQLLGLNDTDVSDALPHYIESRESGEEEYLILFDESTDKSVEHNQKIYDIVYSELLKSAFKSSKQVGFSEKLLDTLNNDISGSLEESIRDKVLEILTDIKESVVDLTGKTPEQLLSEIPDDLDVLKALLFVVKNPARFELFLESLKVYDADQFTRRRALVMWGTLNGLYGVPGEGHNKDNRELWNFIEAKTQSKDDIERTTLHVPLPETTITDGSILGIKLKEKQLVSPADIRKAILSAPRESIGENLYELLLQYAVKDCGSKRKAEKNGYIKSIASVFIPAINPGDALSEALIKNLKQLVKDSKNKVVNKEKLLKDYIYSTDGFAKIYNTDPNYWKSLYKQLKR